MPDQIRGAAFLEINNTIFGCGFSFSIYDLRTKHMDLIPILLFLAARVTTPMAKDEILLRTQGSAAKWLD